MLIRFVDATLTLEQGNIGLSGASGMAATGPVRLSHAFVYECGKTADKIHAHRFPPDQVSREGVKSFVRQPAPTGDRRDRDPLVDNRDPVFLFYLLSDSDKALGTCRDLVVDALAAIR